MTDWLFDTTLYTGLLIALVLLLRRPVAQAFGPQIAYALWALPLLRLLLPPIVLPASLAPQAEPVASTAPMALTLAEAAALPPGEPLPADPMFTLGWSDILVPLWLWGAAAFLAWRIVSYRRMRRDVLADARPVGEVGTIRLVETPAVAAPVAFGVRDRVVALPPFFMAQPDLHARDLAIAHELAHHRGHDLLANFAAQLLLALHWFNPLAWLGWRAMRRDQEAACDARVLAGRGRTDRALYAALITSVAAGPRLALAAPMACPVLGEASIIQRLRCLSRAEPSAKRQRLGRGLLMAGALALPLTASISYAADRQAEQAPPAPAEPLPSLLPPPPPAPALPKTPPFPEPPALPEQPATPMLPHQEAEHATREHREHSAFRTPDPAQFEAFEQRMKEFEREMERHAGLSEAEVKRIERDAERLSREMEREFGKDGHMVRAIRHQAADAEAEAERAETRATAALRACADAAAGEPGDHQALAARCHARATAKAAHDLRRARAAIAANLRMPEDIRSEVLRDLDREIADLNSKS